MAAEVEDGSITYDDYITKSWILQNSYWGEGFLSCNKEQRKLYGDFPEKFKALAKAQGLNLIIEGNFNPTMFDDPNRFIRLYNYSIVVISLDYVTSITCMEELLLMNKVGVRPCPVFYYTDDEFTKKEHQYTMFDRYLALAYKTTDPRDHETVRSIFVPYFLGFPQYLTLSAYAESHISRITNMVNRKRSFPDYDTFCGLDDLAKTSFDFIMKQDVNQNRIKYLGISGSESNYNKVVTDNLCRQSGFDIKSIDLYDASANCYWPCESACDWGACCAQILFDLIDPVTSNVMYNYYKSVMKNLPKQKYILLILNVPTGNRLKALATILDFVSPGSRILFTTTDTDFSGSNINWTKKSYNAGKHTLFLFEGGLLDSNELKLIKSYTMFKNDEEYKSTSDEEFAITSDEEGGCMCVSPVYSNGVEIGQHSSDEVGKSSIDEEFLSTSDEEVGGAPKKLLEL